MSDLSSQEQETLLGSIFITLSKPLFDSQLYKKQSAIIGRMQCDLKIIGHFLLMQQ